MLQKKLKIKKKKKKTNEAPELVEDLDVVANGEEKDIKKMICP